MKIKLFTHTDLDGVGCAIIGRIAFDEIDIEYCEYSNINEKVKDFLIKQGHYNYDLICFTDISVTEDVAEALDIIHNNYCPILLLDHHPTALWLNKYEWADVEINIPTSKPEEKTSGTRMFFDWVVKFGYMYRNDMYDTDSYINLNNFTEIVRKYDTWLWKTKYDDVEPKQWNDLLYIFGREEFVERVINKILHHDYFYFSDFEEKMLDLRQQQIDLYIKEKNESLIKMEIQGYKAGVVFGEQYHSELGNKLCELNPDIDFAVIVNLSRSISYRSQGDFSVIPIAKAYGGGGVFNASGSEISAEIKDKILKILFEKE